MNIFLNPIAGKYSDPKIATIRLEAPVVDVSCPWPQSDDPYRTNENRVMPLKSLKKFGAALKRQTSTFEIDARYFWVSGAYEINFRLRSKLDRSKVKAWVKKALAESGGFETVDEWMTNRDKNYSKTRFITASGSGSGIKVNIHGQEIAYL